MSVIVIAMLVALGVAGMTFAAARGALALNPIVGIRTNATKRSDAAWKAGHSAALPFVFWGGLIVVLLGVLMLLGYARAGLEPPFAGLVLLASELVVAIVAAVFAHRAAAATH